MSPVSPVLDSSVLVDAFVATQARHPTAQRLVGLLLAHDIEVVVPIHALFEVAAAMKRLKREGTLRFTGTLTEHSPLRVKFVDVDQAFFQRYYDESLPYLKAGDLIFLALAFKDSRPLVTEDEKLYEAALQIGVDAYTIEKYLEQYGA